MLLSQHRQLAPQPPHLSLRTSASAVSTGTGTATMPPATSCFRHPRNCSGRIDNSRATWLTGRLGSLTCRTASCLNPGVKARRIIPMCHLRTSNIEVVAVSTESRPLQSR